MLKKDIRRTGPAEPLYIRLYSHLHKYIDSEAARETGKLPTEKELCRIFSVSRNTVSQALSMLASERLICRIKHRGTFLTSAIGEFDPQSLKRTVAAVFPDSSTTAEAAEAIDSECRDLGYDFRLFHYAWGERRDELSQLEKARKCASGIILYPGPRGDDMEYLRQLSGEFPLVLFDLHAAGLACNSVATDHYHGAYALAKSLIGRGCRRFCLLTDRRKISSVILRRAGFLHAIEDSGLSRCAANEWDGSGSFTEFLEAGKFDAVLDTSRHPLTAGVPGKKLFLAAFDQATEKEKECFRTLIARQNWRELGRSAANLIKMVMRSGSMPCRKILIAPEVISD